MDDGLNREASRDLRQLRPALRFLLPYRLQIFVASIALITTAAVTLSIGQGIRLIVDSGFTDGSDELLRQSLLVFAFLVALLTAGTFVRFYFVSWIGERVSADIREAVFNRLISLHPGFFEENYPTEIQSRITTDTTLLQTVIGSSVSIALRNLLMFVGGVILLFVTNFKLSLVVILCVPLVVMPIVFFGRRVRRLSRDSQDRLADVGSYAGESLRHIKIVQAFNHEQADIRYFADRVMQAFRVAVHRIRQRAWLVAMVMLLVMAAIGGMLWVGGQDVLQGDISAGELAAFIFYAVIVAGSVGAISEVFSDLQRAAGATERLVELLLADSALVETEQPQTLPEGIPPLALEDVCFTYPTRPGVQVLTDVCLRADPGEMVALVGPSGAGKSTLFDLFQRFYDPDSGVIRLAGIDIRQLRLEDLRSTMGFVPQEAVLFSGTIADNLRYADPGASDEDLQVALRLAHAEAFVEALPEQLNTPIGEGGTGLSGGQKQRLAIARALVQKPSILLLDEATSALDADSENAIRQSIDTLKGHCSIVVIAHRLSTVRQADRIVVFENGRVLADGQHDDLLMSNPLYARFCRIQFGADSATDARSAG